MTFPIMIMVLYYKCIRDLLTNQVMPFEHTHQMKTWQSMSYRLLNWNHLIFCNRIRIIKNKIGLINYHFYVLCLLFTEAGVTKARETNKSFFFAILSSKKRKKKCYPDVIKDVFLPIGELSEKARYKHFRIFRLCDTLKFSRHAYNIDVDDCLLKF